MKKKERGILGLIVIGIILGVIYVLFSPNQYGVKVSCDNKEILAISKIPPWLMCTACRSCDVDVQVKYNDSLVCFGNSTAQLDVVVVPCKGVEQYKGKEITATANFYLGGNKIGSDTKKLTVP